MSILQRRLDRLRRLSITPDFFEVKSISMLKLKERPKEAFNGVLDTEIHSTLERYCLCVKLKCRGR
jgi:hypothetical protein